MGGHGWAWVAVDGYGLGSGYKFKEKCWLWCEMIRFVSIATFLMVSGARLNGVVYCQSESHLSLRNDHMFL